MLLLTIPGPRGASSTVRVEAGEITTLPVADPRAALAAIAGTNPAQHERPGVVLREQVLTEATPQERWAAGLATTTGRVPPNLDGTLLDLVLLGERARPAPRLLALAAGTGRARASLADSEAAARALAGRVGLARWLDRPLAQAPEGVRTLADLLRCLQAAPEALVVCDPDWLSAADRTTLLDLATGEAGRVGLAAVVLSGPTAAPPGSTEARG